MPDRTATPAPAPDAAARPRRSQPSPTPVAGPPPGIGELVLAVWEPLRGPVRVAVLTALEDVGDRLRPLVRAPAAVSLVLAAALALSVAAVDEQDATMASPAAHGAFAAPAATGAPLPAAATPATASTPPASYVDPEDFAAVDPDAPTEVFGRAGGLELHLPSHNVVMTGFHEASMRGALEMDPRGDHQVLPSRGRPFPGTSAVDIVTVDDDPVRSPVTGKVLNVESYRLYNRYGDRRVTIAPKGHPNVRIVMLHIEGMRVKPGDRVEAGVTEIARSARRFPFRSQIDALTAPDAWPHVHYEVRRR